MNEYRTYDPIIVGIDADQEGAWSGWFYLIREGEVHRFQSLMQLLREMTRYLNREQPPSAAVLHYDGPPNGKLATFTIQVLYRQHNSWQGTLTWHEGHSTLPFRSVLELILQINSALNAGPFEMKETNIRKAKPERRPL